MQVTTLIEVIAAVYFGVGATLSTIIITITWILSPHNLYEDPYEEAPIVIEEAKEIVRGYFKITTMWLPRFFFSKTQYW